MFLFLLDCRMGKSFVRKVGCGFGRLEESARNPYLLLRALISLTHELPITLYPSKH